MTSTRGPRRVRALVGAASLLSGALLLGGCDNPNEVFTGRWEAVQAVQGGVFEGAPILALGHFGREVAGVAYFAIVPGGSLLDPDCPCGFVEHRTVDLESRALEFSTVCDGMALEWELHLVGNTPRRLEGSVRRADGSPGEQAIILEQTDDFVREEDKACPRDSP